MYVETTPRGNMGCCGITLLTSFGSPPNRDDNWKVFKNVLERHVIEYHQGLCPKFSGEELRSLKTICKLDSDMEAIFYYRINMLDTTYMCILTEAQLFNSPEKMCWMDELSSVGFELISVRNNPKYPESGNRLYLFMFTKSLEHYDKESNSTKEGRVFKEYIQPSEPPTIGEISEMEKGHIRAYVKDLGIERFKQKYNFSYFSEKLKNKLTERSPY